MHAKRFKTSNMFPIDAYRVLKMMPFSKTFTFWELLMKHFCPKSVKKFGSFKIKNNAIFICVPKKSDLVAFCFRNFFFRKQDSKKEKQHTSGKMFSLNLLYVYVVFKLTFLYPCKLLLVEFWLIIFPSFNVKKDISLENSVWC